MPTYEEKMAAMMQNMSGDTKRNTDTNAVSAKNYVQKPTQNPTQGMTFGYDVLNKPLDVSSSISPNYTMASNDDAAFQNADLRSEGMINNNPMSRMDELQSEQDQFDWAMNPDSIGSGGGINTFGSDKGSDNGMFGDMTGFEMAKTGLGIGSLGLGVMSYLDAKDANQAREKAMNFDMYNTVLANNEKTAGLNHLKDIFGVSKTATA